MNEFQIATAKHVRAELAQFRALTSDPANAERWAADESAKALLAEAEALIEGSPAGDTSGEGTGDAGIEPPPSP